MRAAVEGGAEVKVALEADTQRSARRTSWRSASRLSLRSSRRLEAAAVERIAGVSTLEEEEAIVRRAMRRGETIASVHDIGPAARRSLHWRTCGRKVSANPLKRGVLPASHISMQEFSETPHLSWNFPLRGNIIPAKCTCQYAACLTAVTGKHGIVAKHAAP